MLFSMLVRLATTGIPEAINSGILVLAASVTSGGDENVVELVAHFAVYKDAHRSEPGWLPSATRVKSREHNPIRFEVDVVAGPRARPTDDNGC
jgi:hypothetical protein